MAVWWLGVVIATIFLFGNTFRDGPIDFTLQTPFDNTHSGHAEQWAFLRAAATHVPPSGAFTIAAPDGETEMSLYMMAVGLLPESRPIPSSYYGTPTEPDGDVRFIFDFGGHGEPRPGWAVVSPLPGGRLLERRTGGP